MKPSATSVEVKAFRLSHGLGLPLPQYQTEEASGMDLMAAVPLTSPLRLLPGMRQLVPTGLTIEIPPGFEGQVRPRSGLALNHGVTVLNAPGTVDSDYRGEVKVLLVNLGRETFVITRGQRIAQLVIQSVARAELIDVRAVNASRRGDAGFGSTGMGATSEAGKPAVAAKAAAVAAAKPAQPKIASPKAAQPNVVMAAKAAAKPTAPVQAKTAVLAKEAPAKPVAGPFAKASHAASTAARAAAAAPGAKKASPAPAQVSTGKGPTPNKAAAANKASPRTQPAKRPAPVASKSKATVRA